MTKRKSEIVFFHGFMGSSEEFASIARELPDWRCRLLDLPGHGASTWVGGSLLEWWDSLQNHHHDHHQNHHHASGSTPPIFVGYSMGGRVALSLSQQGVAVGGLFLESASLGENDEQVRAARRASDAALLDAVIEGRESFEEFLQRWYQRPLFRGLIPPIRKNDPCKLKQALALMGPGEFSSMRETLLQQKYFYLAGEDDQVYAELARSLESSTVVQHASHNVHLMQPQQYLGWLKQFLASL